MSKIKETLQSRKFIITILVIATAITGFFTGHIDTEKMVEIIRWAAGIYVGSLSIEDAAKKVVDFSRKPTVNIQ